MRILKLQEMWSFQTIEKCIYTKTIAKSVYNNSSNRCTSHHDKRESIMVLGRYYNGYYNAIITINKGYTQLL